jgi:hypothetical protein
MKKHNISRKKRTYKKYNKPQFRNFNKYTNLTSKMKGGVNWLQWFRPAPKKSVIDYTALIKKATDLLEKIKNDTLYDWLRDSGLKQQDIKLVMIALENFKNGVPTNPYISDFIEETLKYYAKKEEYATIKLDDTTLGATQYNKKTAEDLRSKINKERTWVKNWLTNYIEILEKNVYLTSDDTASIEKGGRIIQRIIARLPVSIADEMYLGATEEEATAEHARYQKELDELARRNANELAIRNAKDKVVRDSWMNIVGPREEEIKQRREVEKQKRQEEVDKELRKEVEKSQRKAPNFKKLTEFFGLSKEDSLPPISQPPENNPPSDQKADNTPSSNDKESGARTRIGARKQGLNHPLNYDKEITYGQELSKDIDRSRLEEVMFRHTTAPRFGKDGVFQNDEVLETENTGGKSKHRFKRNIKSKKRRKTN